MPFEMHIGAKMQYITVLMPDVVAAIERLTAAVLANTRQEKHDMAQIDEDLTALTAETAALKPTVDSAVHALNGIQGKIEAAVAVALAAGATADQLKAVTDVTAALAAQKQELADAIATVPADPPAPDPVP